MGILDYLPILVVTVASISLIWTEKWRYNIIAIAAQYLVVFYFVLQVLPIGLAAIKLIAGWMAAAVLGASVTATGGIPSINHTVSSKIFRILTALLIIIVVFSVAPQTESWIPISQSATISSLILIGMGLLQLSMTTSSLRVIIGLLSVFSGFEIIYAALVPSVLVAGLLALVTLGISLTGAYWLSLTPSEGNR